jgi:hypothetical protein
VVDPICTSGRRGGVSHNVGRRTQGRTMNKYWKKLCTPEQNSRQVGALAVLAVGLTALLIAWLLGAF